MYVANFNVIRSLVFGKSVWKGSKLQRCHRRFRFQINYILSRKPAPLVQGLRQHFLFVNSSSAAHLYNGGDDHSDVHFSFQATVSLTQT